MKKISFGISLILICTFAYSGGNKAFVIGSEVKIESSILGEERQILVYLPATYHESNTSYPVMYLLDGETHFHHVSGIVAFLSAQALMPEMVVIAIKNTDRSRDFSPSHVDRIPSSGGAEKFMNFLTDELVPFVDRNYRTQDFKLLVGHSFGGTFATYAFLIQPDFFKAYIAISPFLMYDENSMVKKAKSELLTDYNNRWYYMTLGDEPDYFEALDEFSTLLKERKPSGLDFSYIRMDSENHGSIPHLSIYKGLEYIYNEWMLPQEYFELGLTAIDKHYQKLSKIYGFPIQTPEFTINRLGYNYMANNDLKSAIGVFRENVKRFPLSSNVYDSLGEAMEKSQQYEKAGKNYEKAVKLASKTGHPNLKVYKTNLARMHKLLNPSQ